jgi:hypothetical protein
MASKVEETVKVMVRIRPMNKSEKDRGKYPIITLISIQAAKMF